MFCYLLTYSVRSHPRPQIVPSQDIGDSHWVFQGLCVRASVSALLYDRPSVGGYMVCSGAPAGYMRLGRLSRRVFGSGLESLSVMCCVCGSGDMCVYLWAGNTCVFGVSSVMCIQTTSLVFATHVTAVYGRKNRVYYWRLKTVSRLRAVKIGLITGDLRPSAGYGTVLIRYYGPFKPGPSPWRQLLKD